MQTHSTTPWLFDTFALAQYSRDKILLRYRMLATHTTKIKDAQENFKNSLACWIDFSVQPDIVPNVCHLPPPQPRGARAERPGGRESERP